MGASATWPAAGSRPPAKTRLQAGLALLVAVSLVGAFVGYRWWTTRPICLELGEYHDNIPLALSPDGATIATIWSADLRFWDAASGRLGASWAYPYAVNNYFNVDGAFSHDGRTLAVVWIAQHPPGTETLSIDLIDVASGRSRVSIPALSGRLTGNVASCGPVAAMLIIVNTDRQTTHGPIELNRSIEDTPSGAMVLRSP
jgi:hypothetical protein